MQALPLMMIGSSGLQALGAIQSGNAANAQAKAQANAYEYNARAQELQAQNVRQKAAVDEDAQRYRARRVLGEQRAALSEAGIGSEGSASDVVQQSAENATLDALNIRYGGLLEANNLQTQANLDRYQAANTRAQGKAARTAGYLKAGSTLLSGAGDYAAAGKKGMF